jgi:hypothetical protein
VLVYIVAGRLSDYTSFYKWLDVTIIVDIIKLAVAMVEYVIVFTMHISTDTTDNE